MYNNVLPDVKTQSTSTDKYALARNNIDKKPSLQLKIRHARHVCLQPIPITTFIKIIVAQRDPPNRVRHQVADQPHAAQLAEARQFAAARRRVRAVFGEKGHVVVRHVTAHLLVVAVVVAWYPLSLRIYRSLTVGYSY